MVTVSNTDSNARSPFFWTAKFFVGIILWLAVIASLVFLWSKPRQDGQKSTEAESKSGSQTTNNDGQKPLILKTTKDGSVEVVSGARSKLDAVWDEDGIADFDFINVDGRRITKTDLLGKPWIVCFVFTHCAYTCPLVTNSMREMQDRLKDYDFRLVTLTVDPERDTPEVLKGYGETRGANFDKWLFLGGEQRAIYQLIHGSFKMPVQETFGNDRKPGFEFIHSNNIMLVDSSGVVRGKFDATKGESMSELRREIQKLAEPISQKSELRGSPTESTVTPEVR